MKKPFLLISFFLICLKCYPIIYWQPYPIQAVVTGSQMNQRLECSVYDSLLGSWQHYNTVYFNSNIEIENSTDTLIIFHTFLSNPIDLDSIYGFIIYDQELHQFAQLISYEPDVVNNPDHDYHIGKFDGQAYISTSRYDNIQGVMYTNITVYLYDIIKHSWEKNGSAMSDGTLGNAFISIGYGGLTVSTGSWHSNDREGRIDFYGADCQNSISEYETYLWDHGGDQDLYFMQSGWVSTDIHFRSFDPGSSIVATISSSDPGDFNCYGSILYFYDNITLETYFAIYDDSLHHFVIDTFPGQVANIKVKSGVVAFTNASASMLYYEVFSPTSRMWKKDSIGIGLLGPLSIQQGTVHWTDNGSSYIAGFNDTTGWGNFNTPLLLNFHKTDLSATFGYPLIYVRDYSIGAENTWYDFGDGITTIPGTQHSLWHLYKVNGHYIYNFITSLNYSVCIHSGVQSYCESDSIAIYPQVVPVITRSNDTLFSSLASRYQWYLDGHLLTGDTLSFLVVQGDGSYVVVVNTNGCSGTSDPLIITRLEEKTGNIEIVIHPNPVKSQLTIESKLSAIKELRMLNMLGEIIMNPIFSEDRKQLVNLNVSALSPGIYFLKVETEKGTEIQKFIKQ